MRDLLDRSLGPRVAVETAFGPDLPPALVDPAQLELAVLNLAVNARDAMPDGGTLRIEAGRGPDGLLALSVADEGEGMDAATMAQATEPFFTTKGVGRGTGLGLSMVHGLANQSGGRLEMSSAPGRGTTVTVLLPPAGAGAPREAGRAARTPAVGPAAPLRVLAVDDDAIVLMGTVDMLEDMGHQVWPASSGEQALALLEGEARDVDLVVTDQAMPGMTGVDMARRIRDRRPDLPIVLATGYAELPEAAASVIDERLSKPFGDGDLAGAIARARRAAPAARAGA